MWQLGTSLTQISLQDISPSRLCVLWIGKEELILKAPNTIIADIANIVDQDETAQYEASHLGLQCLPSGL